MPFRACAIFAAAATPDTLPFQLLMPFIIF
jgi:hypothetical protein